MDLDIELRVMTTKGLVRFEAHEDDPWADKILIVQADQDLGPWKGCNILKTLINFGVRHDPLHRISNDADEATAHGGFEGCWTAKLTYH